MNGSSWRLRAEPMEPRILHSADVSPLAWSGDSALHARADLATADASAVRSEIVFVDTTLPDAQSLIDDLRAQCSAGRPIEIVIIEAGTDGLALIGQTLAERHDLGAVHVLAHGSDGRLQLGTSVLDAQTLLQRAGDIAAWSDALAPGADLLLYGCDLAQTEVGQRLVTDLSGLTGADVAASTDLTGAAARGGDWTLEFATGRIEATLAPSRWEQAQWQGVLATYTVTTTTDVVGSTLLPGTLRWAIAQANANPGTDTIVFAVNGSFNMAAGSSGGDDNKTGDFDITDSVNIVGNGSASTVINGNGVDRVFDVRSGTVSFSGLTIQGGASNTGAGVRIGSSEIVTMLDVVVQNNVGNGASKGGGIYNDGQLTLRQVIVQNNGDAVSGDVDGAGIYNAGNLVARDVEIRGNLAAGNKDGGGLYVGNGSVVTLENVTLAENQAKRGGGIFNSDNTTTLTNVTLSGNTASSAGGGLWTDKFINFDHVTVAYNMAPTGLGGGVFDNGLNVQLHNSLFVGNVGGNTNKALTSLGYNLSDDNSLGFTGTGDLRNVAAGAGALASNGGFTRTVSIGAGSAARDAANPVTSLTADQRGMATVGGRTDIGAYEYNPYGVPPTIGTVADQTTDEDQTLAPIGFTIGDAETNPGSLVLSAISSNTALVPNANIVFGGSGANRTISLTPAPNANSPANGGAATITITVSDGGNTTSTSFIVTVQPSNDPPGGNVTITGTPAQGQTLTASNTLTDPDGLGTIGYQWLADGVAISGATGSTFLLGQAQVGKVITVKASYTDGFGTAESATSVATAPVANVNDAPTGSVTITGTPAQGQTLTAANSLADADGLGPIGYQWLADGVAISGATGSTLVLGQAQVGKAITVTARYTDGFGTVESVTSAATAAVRNVNDAPTGAVTIGGTPAQGQTLTASNTLADVDGLGPIGYQWLADGVAISGATGSTLVLGQAQVGKAITVTARYTDGFGTVESVTSAATAAVRNVNDAPTGAVTIGGTPAQGQTLTAANSLADADGLGTIGYQWLADGVAISGATGSTLVLSQAQVGKAITVTARYTDGFGNVESVTSLPTAAVANVNDLPTGSLTITGTATRGQTLTLADTLADADGLGAVGYQWAADGVDIAGATGSSLTLGLAEVGTTITVRASYTDGFGTAESVTSAATAVVTPFNNAPTGGVTIGGTPAQGQTLTASNTLADADGLGPIGYQWFADGVAISGAAADTLLLGQAEVGKVITVTARYTDGGATVESVTSAATAAVSNVNDVPTGGVTIGGTPTQGQTLTASNTLADADGLGAIGYQWFADGVALSGATGSTLVLGQTEVGKVISVTANYTDGFGASESIGSAGTAMVSNVNDAPTGNVTIGGTPTQGQTLTASNTLADADGLGTIGYQWFADGVALSGATGSTLVLGQAEVGKVISVTASYTDGFGTAESVTCAATAAVANANDTPTGSVTIGGAPVQGQTLTASNTLADADGLGTIGYQWFADGVALSGATGSTLVLGQAEVGKTISVTANYTDGFGTAESIGSAATAAVANVNDAPTGGVAIGGTPAQGQMLTATNSLADADGLGAVGYQWLADGVAISGATASTLVLGQAEVGKVISVTASYTDGFGTAESVTSAPMARVANANDLPAGTVTIGGTPAQGQTLTASNTLADADGLGPVAYQWFADGVALGGATGSTLVLGQAEVGKTISVTASYTDGFGTAESIGSAGTAMVSNVNDAPIGNVTIGGTPAQGQTLTASNTMADADGLGIIGYQWFADGVPLSGATGSTLVLGQAEVGKAISVLARYTDGFGTAESVTSTATVPVANVNDAPVLAQPIGDQAVMRGATLQFALPPATFTDPDAGDVIVYSASLADGSALPNWIRFDALNQVFIVTPDAAVDPGAILVRVVATDAAGASAQASFAFIVVTADAPRAAPEIIAPAPAAVPPVAAPPAAPAAPVPAAAPAAAAPAMGLSAPAPAPAQETVPVRVAEETESLAGSRKAGLAFESTAVATVRFASSRGDTVLATAPVELYADLGATPLTQLLRGDELQRKLEELQRQMAEFGDERRSVVASSVAVTSGLSIGYVIWLVRGGVLVSSMLSALPVWQMVDPMPVLAAGGAKSRRDRRADADEPEVERLFDEHPNHAAHAPAPAAAPSAADVLADAARRPEQPTESIR